MRESEIEHKLKLDISMYNKDGIIYPSSYMKLTINMIEEHLDCLDIGEKALMSRYGVSWVLLHNQLEFVRPIHPDDKLTARTWHSGTRMPIFRRDYEITDANGEVVLRGASLSTLFDVAKRKICMDRQTYALIDIEAGPQLIRADRLFRYSDKDAFVPSEKMRIRSSMLDGIGHVNNTRYGEIVWDAMTAEERSRLSAPRSMGAWYINELVEDDEVEVQTLHPDDTTDVYRCVCGGNTVFGLKFTF